MSALESLQRRLKKDKGWATFKSVVKMAWNPEFDNFYDEILRLHKMRGIRSIQKNTRARKLADAALQDQAQRSRLVEIAITILRNRNMLEVAINNEYKYIEATYGSMLVKKGCKTKMDQKATIEACLRRARERMEQMDTLIEIGDRVIEDVDKASYSIKHGLDALTLSTKREYAS